MPVVVGFVPTPEGKAALRRAVIECQLRGTSLIVVSAEHSSESAASPDAAAEVRQVCAELGVDEPVTQIRRNRNAYEPADDVLSVAQESDAELIVIGLRRRTAVGKLILGGSAQRILLDASCPVLAVKVDRTTSPRSAAESNLVTGVGSTVPGAQSAQSAQSAQLAPPAQLAQSAQESETV